MHYETIEYKGFSINVHQDECASNPLKDWQTLPVVIAALAYGGRYDLIEYNGATLEVPELTREQIKHHARELCELFSIDSLLRLTDCAYHYRTVYVSAADCINCAIQQLIEGECTVDKIQTLEQLHSIAGNIALASSGAGYSQRDQFECLAIATPEWLEETGIKPDNARAAMEGIISEYRAYAFGDCWFYTIEDADGEIVDSCAGYYGEYNGEEWQYMLSEARAAIDYHIRETRRARLARIKQLIKARAPLFARVQFADNQARA